MEPKTIRRYLDIPSVMQSIEEFRLLVEGLSDFGPDELRYKEAVEKHIAVIKFAMYKWESLE